MKVCNHNQENTRPFGRVFILASLMVFLGFGNISAQDDVIAEEVVQEEVEEEEIKPVKNTFESIWLIDAQTVMVPVKGTLEADFQHRFGTINDYDAYDNFYGIFENSNIRIGIDYVPVDRLLIGFGFTKFNHLWDFYGKYAILRQMKGGGSPVSLNYYVNAAVDTRDEKEFPDPETFESSDRWSFFHQVMVARKISDKFSLQVSGNLSWFNYKEHVYDTTGADLGQDKNAQISMTALGRYKISNTIAVIAEYDLPITDQEFSNMESNLSFGIELVTSSHAFQLFVGNFQGLVPQYNHTYNYNNNPDNRFLIGFNITRLWNL